VFYWLHIPQEEDIQTEWDRLKGKFAGKPRTKNQDQEDPRETRTDSPKNTKGF
jgi:hypothetical protein